jgi:hypothetical protein
VKEKLAFETDFLTFNSGMLATIGIGEKRGMLVQ